MIHYAYNKAAVAELYYQKKYPDRKYDRDAARKQFQQDNNIDEKILLAVLKEIFNEQKAML